MLRHLLTASVTIEFDDDTGRLAVVSTESVEAADVEVEMLDARLITQPQQLNESRARARDFEGNLLDRTQADGSATEVELRSTDIAGLVPLARNLHEHLVGGQTIKMGPDRRPKVGAPSKQVKQAAPLFEAVLSARRPGLTW